MPSMALALTYDDARLDAATERLRQQLAQDKILGLVPAIPKHEARALLDQYLETVLEANEAMAARGIAAADFPEMFNELLRRFDAVAPAPAIAE